VRRGEKFFALSESRITRTDHLTTNRPLERSLWDSGIIQRKEASHPNLKGREASAAS
jgi:hypothetical protein